MIAPWLEVGRCDQGGIAVVVFGVMLDGQTQFQPAVLDNLAGLAAGAAEAAGDIGNVGEAGGDQRLRGANLARARLAADQQLGVGREMRLYDAHEVGVGHHAHGLAVHNRDIERAGGVAVFVFGH